MKLNKTLVLILSVAPMMCFGDEPSVAVRHPVHPQQHPVQHPGNQMHRGEEYHPNTLNPAARGFEEGAAAGSAAGGTVQTVPQEVVPVPFQPQPQYVPQQAAPH